MYNPKVKLPILFDALSDDALSVDQADVAPWLRGSSQKWGMLNTSKSGEKQRVKPRVGVQSLFNMKSSRYQQ